MSTDLLDARRTDLRQRILAAAWELAERDGLTGWTLRDLGAAVGMRAPSLYTHFDGKDAIHDAMFAAGWQQLLDEVDALPLAGLTVAERLTAVTEAFCDFSTASVPRYQLLFTHVLGAWEPSPASYAVSQTAYRRLVEELAAVGVSDPAEVDLWTAISAGLVAQQLANDRGGDRWRRLVPDAVSMFLTHVGVAPTTAPRSAP